VRPAVLTLLWVGCASAVCPPPTDVQTDAPTDTVEEIAPACRVAEGRVFVGPAHACPSTSEHLISLVIYDDQQRVIAAHVPARCASGALLYDAGSLPVGHYFLALDSPGAALRGVELLEPERCRDTFYEYCPAIEFDVRACGVTVVHM